MSVIKRQTILGTLYSYLGVSIGVISMGIIVPNFFSTEEYGLINLLARWTQILVIVVSLGFNSAGTRFFNFFRKPEENYRGYLFNGFVVVILGTIISGAFLYFFKDWVQNTNGADNSLFVKYYYLILPITFSTGIFNLFDNYAKGLYDTVVGTFLSQFFIRLMVLGVIILYVFDWLNFHQFMIFWAIAMSSHALFMILHCVRLGNFSLKPSSYLINSSFKKEFVRFAAYSVLTSLSTIVISSLDGIMVYKFLGLAESGIYNFCLLFGSVMTMAYNANTKAATPIIMDALQKEDISRVESIFKKSGLTQLMFGSIILVLVWVSIDSVFGLVKPEFLVGKTALIIIGLSKLYDLSSGVNALILAYSRYYKYDSLLVISFIGFLYVLNHLMIPKWGLEGAAVATFIALVYYNSVRNILIWKFFKIHPYSFAQLKSLIISVFVLVLGFYLPDITSSFRLSFFNFNESFVQSFLTIAYKSTLLGAMFLGLFYFFKVSEEVNKLLESIVKKVFKF